MLNRGLDKLELLRIVEAVANEKSIDKELVIGSMESAIQKAALTKFGNDNNIEVIIDRESGEIKIQKVLDIVEKVEDSASEGTGSIEAGSAYGSCSLDLVSASGYDYAASGSGESSVVVHLRSRWWCRGPHA